MHVHHGIAGTMWEIEPILGQPDWVSRRGTIVHQPNCFPAMAIPPWGNPGIQMIPKLHHRKDQPLPQKYISPAANLIPLSEHRPYQNQLDHCPRPLRGFVEAVTLFSELKHQAVVELYVQVVCDPFEMVSKNNLAEKMVAHHCSLPQPPSE